MSERSLAGRQAVVTGGGTGIGAAIACALSDAGARVIVMGRNLERLEQTASCLPKSSAIVVDVTDEERVKAAFGEAGDVDILVNNAGGVETAPFDRTAADLWKRMIDVNLNGAFYCSQQVVKSMTARGYGRIINVASTAALKGYPYVTAYCAAKHGLLGLTRSLALEVARTGITVNAVCPGYTETDLFESSVKTIMEATGRSKEDAEKALLKDSPQGRLIRPDEVAATVLWLCSPDASSITGQAIAIAGGEVM